MEAFDQLDLVAEIAAALLGFFAVFLALSKRDGRFAESDRHFVQAFVLSSTLAIIFAMLPRTLTLVCPDAPAWRTAAIVAVTLGSPVIFLQAWLQFHMPREEALQIHWVWHVGAWFFGLSSAALFIIAIFNSVATTEYFVAGVTMLVPLCLWVFIGVVFRRFF